MSRVINHWLSRKVGKAYPLSNKKAWQVAASLEFFQPGPEKNPSFLDNPSSVV